MSDTGTTDSGSSATRPGSDFTAAYVAAWNSHDPDGVLGFMTSDVVYDHSAWPVTMRGHDEVRAFMQSSWRAFPDLRFEVIEGPYLLGQDKAAFWWRATGTMTGLLGPPGFAPTGKSWEAYGADFVEYREGRLARLRAIVDVADASQQLGLMPSPGSRGERVSVAVQRLAVRFTRR